MKASSAALLLALLGLLHLAQARSLSDSASRIVQQKPNPNDKVLSARWLVSSADWGVIATKRSGGRIFSNVVSYSDGISSQTNRENSTGIPYFYLSKMDETARALEDDPTASLTVSEKTSDVDGRCGAMDAMEPPCARITLMGKVVPVRGKQEIELALKALFSKHPAMERWPRGHGFAVYKMMIHEVFFLNNYGGAVPVPTAKYLAARLQNDDKEPDVDQTSIITKVEETPKTLLSASRRRLLREEMHEWI